MERVLQSMRVACEGEGGGEGGVQRERGRESAGDAVYERGVS